MTEQSPPLHGELRTLSSELTEARKALGIGGASLVTILAFVLLLTSKAQSTPFLFGISAVLWLLVWVRRRLSVVETDGYWLLVSSFTKTVWIPLAQVVSVSRVWLPGAQRIYVEIGPDTPLGREIVFEAPFDLGAIVGEHPVVGELRALVAQARGAAHSGRAR